MLAGDLRRDGRWRDLGKKEGKGSGALSVVTLTRGSRVSVGEK